MDGATVADALRAVGCTPPPCEVADDAPPLRVYAYAQRDTAHTRDLQAAAARAGLPLFIVGTAAVAADVVPAPLLRLRAWHALCLAHVAEATRGGGTPPLLVLVDGMDATFTAAGGGGGGGGDALGRLHDTLRALGREVVVGAALDASAATHQDDPQPLAHWFATNTPLLPGVPPSLHAARASAAGLAGDPASLSHALSWMLQRAQAARPPAAAANLGEALTAWVARHPHRAWVDVQGAVFATPKLTRTLAGAPPWFTFGQAPRLQRLLAPRSGGVPRDARIPFDLEPAALVTILLLGVGAVAASVALVAVVRAWRRRVPDGEASGTREEDGRRDSGRRGAAGGGGGGGVQTRAKARRSVEAPPPLVPLAQDVATAATPPRTPPATSRTSATQVRSRPPTPWASAPLSPFYEA